MTNIKDIAVIGRSCRLPGASSIDDLWTLLEAGTCAVSRIPEDRWSLDRMAHPRGAERGKSYTWAAGTLDDVWSFDPAAFGLSPREAEQMDPQQRLLLELAWEALEDAGIRPSRIAGSETGVFVGASALDYGNLRIIDAAAGDAYLMTGNTLSIIANRISYIFDLHGPSFTVDTACSSALVALNEAVVSLRSGRIDTAIVGGVNVLASPFNFIGFSQASMLSRIGLCQAFSAKADGYVRAEGGVVLVLRTREAAERAGDHIHGFITGADVNSDGRTNGISLPSKAFQARLLENLYIKQGLDPATLAFVEAHGTGTRVGDPIEAMAIGETLATKRDEPLLIGSIKTNIGHMEAASGLGGVLKAMLALEHDALPPSLHSGELNPDIDFEALNLHVARKLTPLARPKKDRRIAGINSFGFGGTNAHVIITDGPRQAVPHRVEPDPAYLVISAHSRAALGALVADYAVRLDKADDKEANAIVTAAAYRRERLSHRVVIPMGPRHDLVATLDRLGDAEQDVVGAARGTAIERDTPVAFVFSGNGSQYVGMGTLAYTRNADFRKQLDLISAEFQALAGWSIAQTLFDHDLAAKLELTQISQPLLYAVQSATAYALRARGLVPAFVLGHSVGEVAAAEAAGILDQSNAIKTIFARSLHQELTFGRGGMAVIIGSREAAEQIVAALPGLEIAAYNSPRAFTVSGPPETIEKLSGVARAFKARIRKLDLAYPFHSALMAPVERPLLRSLADLAPARSTLPFISTVSGDELRGPELDAHYWWRNVREPVRFADAIAAAAKAGARIFVEIGPTASLLSHINDCIDERTASIATLCALDKKDRGDDPIATAVAVALARGAAVDEEKAFGPTLAPGTTVPLPAYPWQRKVYRLPDSTESPGLTRSGTWHPLIGARFSPDRHEWHSTIDTSLYPSLADHCVDGRAILPGAAFAEMALAVARDWLGTDKATVADLEITSPMILTPDSSREVVCRLSPLVNHLEIASRPRLGQTPWQTHATAKIIKDAAAAVLPEADDHAPVSNAHVITGSEIYAMAARAGLAYGPTFQKLATAVASRPDRINLNLTKEPADPAYGVDPARMDACFHALVLIFSSLRDAVHGTAYIPVRFGEIVLRRPGVTFTKARIDVLRRDERIIIANFFLTDEDDDIVVFMREARFQAIRTSRGLDVGKQMIMRTSVLASEPTASRGDRPLAVATLRRGIQQASTQDGMTPDFVLLEGWATAIALNAARDLATAGFIDVDALVASGRLPAKARPWLEDLLVSLDRSGLSHMDKLGRHVDPDIELPDPNQILRTLAAEHQNLGAELLIAASVDAAIKALTVGDFKTFARPLSTKSIDGWELGGSQPHAAAATIIEILRRSRAAWPKDRAMRILQIGYGPLTGITAALADETEARLTIFDPDRRRLERARMTLDGRGDIAFLDKAADLTLAGFDFVIAAHSLYRYWRDSSLWSHLRRAMARGAIFLAIEPMPSFFRDLVLGLDARLAEDSDATGYDGLSVSEADWLEAMQAIGLGDPDVMPILIPSGGALLLTAQVEAERRHWSGAGNALIIGDGDARGTQITSAFATLLASSGLHVSIVLDCELTDDRLGESAETIIFFASASEDPIAPVKNLLDQCMRLKQLTDRIGARKTALWVVTSGAFGSGKDGRASDVAAGLWAFTRTLANEMPTLDVRRIDVTGDLRPDLLAERLRDLVLSKTDETEILLGPALTRVVRFEMATPQDRGQSKRAEAARLTRGEGSGIDRIHWEAISRQAPGPNDVEIAVEAIGLNFRDVMFGLGLLPEDILEHGFAGPTLGLECAGRIERVGASVKGFQPGDPVIAFAKNAFATHVTTPAAVVAAVPKDMPADMAATIPVAFLTAYHALIMCARLKPGEWVLIHGGAGGVGLAAIQIARWRNARVIATAGSPEKRALLAALGAEHVFDSRSGAFVEDVRRVTGEGVGVVLNSLSGEAMERGIGVLRPFGRFVELGKRDYVANTHVGLRPFRRNLSYFGVDLDQLLIDDPAASRVLMRSVLGLFAKGVLTPLPYRAFDASETIEAFRLMQQSGHIGKLVVRPPRPEDIVAKQRRAFQVSTDKMHLITGGFGGFGLETARWLAEKGAKHLLLVGRSGAASQTAREALAAFAAKGVRVRTEALDIGDKAAVQRLFARFGKDLPALAGVVHAAMVLDDAMVPNLTAERFEQVLRPKVAGADNLDQLTRSLSLDYFVLFSSATTLIGNPGQAAYVAANGYLEGLAQRRRSEGLPALAISWGAIEDVGVLARSEATREALAKRVGIRGMLAQDALRLMGEALSAPSSTNDAVVAIAPMNWAAARQHLSILRSPSYKKLTSQGEAKASEQTKLDIGVLVTQNTPEEARKIVSSLIVEEIARVLRLPREDVARTTPLGEIGLDSLMAVELALGLEERFTLRAPLSATASTFTVNELADHVIGLATGALSGDDAMTRSMAQRHLGSAADSKTIDAASELMKQRQEVKGLLQ